MTRRQTMSTFHETVDTVGFLGAIAVVLTEEER